MSSRKKDIYNDERFAHLMKNNRFKKIPKKESKIKVDERFQDLLNDRFNLKFQIDKYGRKLNKKPSDDLKKFYELTDSDDDDDEEGRCQHIMGNAVISGGNKIEKSLMDKLKNLEVDYIRGEGILQSDSSDDSSSSEEENNDESDKTMIDNWIMLDHNADRTDESSRRIACMHMDWDRIRAVDIMILCNSFIPPGFGSVLSVKIYPSEYGKARMAEEEYQGPKELTAINRYDDKNENEEVDEECAEYREKLRQYQLNRLKYYYAVVEFDSVKSAEVVYNECDGLEYESTANRLDFRFISDDILFDDEPKDTCTEIQDLSAYEPRIFVTSALNHAKVELTWDETDVNRKEISEKLFSNRNNEVSEYELKKIVAFSSDSEEEDNYLKENHKACCNSDNDQENNKSNDKIDQYKSLLEEIRQKEEQKRSNQIEMEYTWSLADRVGGNQTKREEIIKNHLTPFEEIIERKKQKKKIKMLARKRNVKTNNDSDHCYSSSDFDDIDLNDPYFAEEFQNDEYKKPKKRIKIKKSKQVESRNDLNEENLQTQKELDLILQDEYSVNKSHFSLKKIQEDDLNLNKKKKRKMDKSNTQTTEITDTFTMKLDDARFNALFHNPEFNIDPTDKSYKKTKGMEKLIQEKVKKAISM